MAGLTTAGLEIKRSEDVRADLENEIKGSSAFGPGASTRAAGPMGKLIGIVSSAIGLLWELAQQVYDAFDPDQAAGEALDNLAALVGVTRLAATYTTGTITATGTAATSIPAGSLVRIASTGAEFETTEGAVIGGGGTVDIPVQATSTGPIEVSSGQTWQIVTVIAGWSSVANAAAFATGRAQETDAQLRLRREDSLQIIGAATVGAIRSRLRQLEGVLTVRVRENDGDTTDADGIPPHSFEVVVYPDSVDEEAVAEAIYRTKAAGVRAYGSSVTATVTDSQGFDHSVSWTWATVLDVYVTVTLTYDAEDYPGDGDDQVAAAVAAAGADLDVGDDVILLDFIVAAASVAGVTAASVTAKIGSAPGGGDTSNLPITFREIASVDVANVLVNSSAG